MPALIGELDDFTDADLRRLDGTALETLLTVADHEAARVGQDVLGLEHVSVAALVLLGNDDDITAAREALRSLDRPRFARRVARSVAGAVRPGVRAVSGSR